MSTWPVHLCCVEPEVAASFCDTDQAEDDGARSTLANEKCVCKH